MPRHQGTSGRGKIAEHPETENDQPVLTDPLQRHTVQSHSLAKLETLVADLAIYKFMILIGLIRVLERKTALAVTVLSHGINNDPPKPSS